MRNSFFVLMSHFPFRQIISPVYDSEGFQSDLLDKLEMLLDRCHYFRNEHKAFSAEFSQKATWKENTQFQQSQIIWCETSEDFLMGPRRDKGIWAVKEK